MTRHKSRVIAFQTLFAWEFSAASLEDLCEFSWLTPQEKKVLEKSEDVFVRLLVAGTIENKEKIDDLIKKFLTTWNFDRIGKVDLAILRMSIYSLLFQRDIHPTVVINEAVDIAKEFAADDSYKFINAMLDNIRKFICGETVEE